MEEKQIRDRLWESYELSHSAAMEQRIELESAAKANRRISELKRAFREQKKLLRKHRAALLEAIHGEQKKLDCLDDLLYLLEKEKRENP